MAAANCTCFNMRKATRAVTQLYDKALRPSGLRATQFSMLSVVQDRGPVGITDLAKALATDRTTLSRNLKPLLERGLLEIADGEDRRERLIAMTSNGGEALSQAVPLWHEVQTRVIKNLGRDRWTSLLDDLNEASDRFQAT